MRTLDEIGKSFGTDKSSTWHNYLARYEPYFAPLRDKPVRVMETGVLGGASLSTWAEYFPLGTIYGLDIDAHTLQNFPERCVGIHADTNSTDFWNHWLEFKFDIIIDDGDHHASAQEFCFRAAWQRVIPGGLYIVEDIHFSRGGIMPFINGLITELNARWDGLTCGDPAKDNGDILFIHCWKGFVIIGKKPA